MTVSLSLVMVLSVAVFLLCRLPTGVFVVGTYRTGFAPTALHTSRVVVHLNPDDPRNHRDVTLHLDTVLREEALAARLAAAGVGRDAFITEITARCGGVWVYLRYVLEVPSAGSVVLLCSSVRESGRLAPGCLLRRGRAGLAGPAGG